MIENKIAADARIEHTAATPAIHVDKYNKNSQKNGKIWINKVSVWY